MAGFEILLPRLSVLQEAVQAEGYESEIFAYNDRWPELHFYVRPENGDEFDSDTVVITNLPDGSDEFRHFLLNAECLVKTAGHSEGFVRLACDMLNAQTTGGFAYPDRERELLVYRGVLPEAEVPVSREAFVLFLQLFTAHLAKLKRLLEIETEKAES